MDGSGGGGQTLVLVVDDDVRTSRLLVRMLQDEGFEVELETDGAAALARLERAPMPDALVTDFRMPNADGVRVASFARAQKPGLPVFVVTSYPHHALPLEEAMEPPPIVLTKPLDYDTLSAGLHRATDALRAR